MWLAERRCAVLGAPYKSSKRSFETFSEASGGRTDWLCDPGVKLDVLKPILQGKDTSIRILIPGIGHSTLASDLRDEGYTDVTVADLNEDQVSQENRDGFAPIYFDLVKDGVAPKLQSSFDLVIDSSVTDVFLQLTNETEPNVTQAKKVHEKLLSMLKPDGTMVVFSMNNRPWDKIYKGNTMHRMHLRLRPIFHVVLQRGRATRKVGEDVLVLVAARSESQLLQLNQAQTDTKYASVTKWSPVLPEDWSSQRS